MSSWNKTFFLYSLLLRRLLHDTNLGALSSSCLSSSSINRKYRTSVKWRTLNPEFREEFSLKVSIVDLPRLALVISVWDKDLGKNDDYIGENT